MKTCDIALGMEVAVKRRGYLYTKKATVIGFEKVHQKYSTKQIAVFSVEFSDHDYDKYAQVTAREILDTWDNYASETERKRKESLDLYKEQCTRDLMEKNQREVLVKILKEYGISLFGYHGNTITITLDALEKLVSNLK